MPYYAATYEFVADAAAIEAARPGHRDWLSHQPALRLSGPDDANGALLIWEASDAAEVEALLDEDPYTPAGVIAARRVVGWRPILGSWSTQLAL
ncbi:MAG: hypothetical protein F2667_02305 [Actinobacteria bacterium]|uniref:Unannotated protein n=1 Tax=freshwater metagenome TaxID=449393 RepID=A0A6J6P496_9ZZZZ|nr:hypothetical protein [Actinomycetota bacterium]